jgi:hypothetical protein
MYKTYTSPLTGVVQVVRLLDNAFIQPNEEYPDYQDYLAWVAEGNTPEEWSADGNQ